MTVCTKLAVAVDDFLLPRVLTTRPEVRVELERMVPFGEGISPFLWVSSTDTGWLRETVDADPTAAGISRLDPVDGGSLLAVGWNREAVPVACSITGPGATCLRGVGRADGWSLVVRFESRDRLGSCHRYWAERGLDVTIERLHEGVRTTDHGAAAALTSCQRETLRAALDAGYFEVPRRTTLQELSSELGVSDTATSQRIRRGLRELVATEVI